jgi:uncharacterized protein YjbJ (UPF0337 family)
MNWDQLEGKWKQMKGSIREQWGKLTDDDLEVIAGKRDRLIGKVQERYGYITQEAQKRVDEWVASLREPRPANETQQPAQQKTYTGKP